MRTDGKTNNRVASKLQITKLSVVTKPAHENALSRIIKSKENNEKIVKLLFDDALADMEMGEILREVLEDLMVYNSALRKSLIGIYEEDVEDKPTAFRTTIGQYISQIQELVDESDLFKFKADENQSTETLKLEELTTEDINKVTDILKSKGIEIRKEKQMGDKDKNLDIQKMIDDAIKKSRETDEKELSIYKALAQMTDEQKAFYTGLDDVNKKAFEEADYEGRQAIIEKAKRDESIVKVCGQEVRKGELTPAIEAIILKLAGQVETVSKQNENLVAENEIAKFKAIAEKDYPFIPGDSLKKAKMLMEVEKMSPEAKETALAVLKSNNESMMLAFETFGHNQPSEMNIEKTATQIQKDKTMENLKKIIEQQNKLVSDQIQ